MCDPVTIGIASTVMSAGSALMQGRAQQQSADANAAIAEKNAQLAREQANETQRQKAREMTELNQKKQQVLATQRVAMAGSGIDPTMGSGLNLLESTVYSATQDSNNLEWNAARNEWQLKSQATDYDNQAANLKAQGQNAMAAGMLGAATTVGFGAYNLYGGGAKVGGANVGGKAVSSPATRGLVSPVWGQYKNANAYNRNYWGR